MQRLRVAAVGLITLGIAVACADPISNPQSVQDEGLDQSALADRSDGPRGQGQGGRNISVLDDCDPNDPGWAPTGGCTLKRGKVTEAEFRLLLGSPLSASVVGHPAWRNEPSYLSIDTHGQVHVRNRGGRFHTFTKVAQFGGGRVPLLNQGLTIAPECALAPGAVDPNGLTPGSRHDIGDLGVGIHRYMCCIHPWMRALIKVTS